MQHNHDYFIGRAEATGRWWEDPWWAQADCDIYFTVPLEAVNRGAAVLSKYFDADWYISLAKAPRPNLVFPKLCLERSTMALAFIASLGARLETLRDVENLQRPIRVLREAYGDSAFLELEGAESFVQEGFRVSFPKEGSAKNADFIATRDGDTVAVECKRLDDEVWEDWESSLMSEITRALPWQHGGKEIIVQVALNPRLSDVRFGQEDYTAVNTAISGTIVTTIVAAIHSALAQQLPCEGLISDIARFRIDLKQPGTCGGVTGMERSVPAIFRRMFQNGVFRALEQLPKGKPGVIILYSKHAPPAEFFRLLFDAACEADRERFSDLIGVLICTLQTWFTHTTPTYFENVHTRHSLSSKVVAEMFKKTFPASPG